MSTESCQNLDAFIENISITYDFNNKDKVVFLNTSDIYDGKVINHNWTNVSALPGQAKKSIKKGDILFSEIRPVNRRFAMVDFDTKNYVISTKIMVIRPKNGILKNYLYLCLTNNETLKYLQFLAESRSGTFPQITIEQIQRMKVYIPSVDEQKRIIQCAMPIISKIELNNRVNKILEEIAQAIFKCWFIDFEFPNENGEPYKSSGGEMVESELSPIPKGWEIGKLGNSKICKLKSPGIDKFIGKKIYLATACVSDTNIINTKTNITYSKRPSRANMQPESNTIWFAKMKNSRKLLMFDSYCTEAINEYILSTGFAAIKSKEASLYYLWNFICNKNFEETKNRLCNGTTMQAINNKNINNIKIIIPSENILLKFNQLEKNIFEIIYINSRENKILSGIRYKLIPKLISGEIRVPINNREGDE